MAIFYLLADQENGWEAQNIIKFILTMFIRCVILGSKEKSKPFQSFILLIFSYATRLGRTYFARILNDDVRFISQYISASWNAYLLTVCILQSKMDLCSSGIFIILILVQVNQRLHRCWWRMLETKCVGDKSEMLVTNSRCWWPI